MNAKIALSLAIALLTSATTVAAAPPNPVTDQTGARPAASEASLASSMSAVRSAVTLEASLPAFLQDDEDAETQLRQLQIFYRQNDIREVWRQYMVPAVAPEAVGSMTVDAVPADTPPYTPAELETFRADLDGFMVDLQTLLNYLPDQQAMDTAERLDQSRQVVEIATHEQLAEVKRLYDQYPGYLDTPAAVLGVLQGGASVDSVVKPRGNPWLPDPLDPGLMPNVVVPVPDFDIPRHPNCRTYGGTGIADNGTCTGCPAPPAGGMSTVFALETAAFVNGAICEYIPDAIFVLSISIQNPFKLICTTLRAALEIAAASVALANNLNGDCEVMYHNGIIHAYLDAEVSTRASQQSFDYFTLTSNRIEMEHDLLNELNVRVSTFQMPESLDGYLDRQDDLSVRYIVTDTIGMQLAAGYTDLHNAVDEYNAAEEHLADGDYKNAYARYRKAYRAAVRVGREP